MIILRGKYPDQGLLVFKSKKPEKIVEWLEQNLLEKGDLQDSIEFDKIEQSILNKDPNQFVIANWLWKKDRLIERWD